MLVGCLLKRCCCCCSNSSRTSGSSQLWSTLGERSMRPMSQAACAGCPYTKAWRGAWGVWGLGFLRAVLVVPSGWSVPDRLAHGQTAAVIPQPPCLVVPTRSQHHSGHDTGSHLRLSSR